MKYTVKMSCGHTQVVDLVGKGSERERKIRYFEEFGLCKECYKKQLDETDNKKSLEFNIEMLPEINEENGQPLVYVWFGGNTKPNKEAIKSLKRYWWQKVESSEDTFWYTKPKLAWGRTIDLSEINSEIERAASIGAKLVTPTKGLLHTISYSIACEKQKAWKTKNEMIKTVKKPDVPKIIANQRWNNKVYGRTKNYSIYINGEKINITDEQAEDLKRYAVEKEEYTKKVDAILEKY